jgi:NADPH:quinone reductase-like Zn-dependent oxidoreductase
MKAIVWTDYGPPEVLQLQEVTKPVPQDNEILVRVYATTVTAGDCEMRSLQMPFWLGLPMRLYAGFSRPSRIKIIGQELAGEVEAVGKKVKKFKPGDPVFGLVGFGKTGAYAEYTCLSEELGGTGGVLAIKPSNMTYEQAAAVPLGGLEALHFLRQANIQGGERVLVNGAGGSIGTMGVQLARHFGAEVTAVDSSGKLDLLRSLGAVRVIDYTQEDFTQGGEEYDVIFDVVGKSPFSRSLQTLRPNGRYLIANPNPAYLVQARLLPKPGNRQVITGTASYQAEDLAYLRELIEAGIIRAVIDRTYPLEQIVEAHRYVETGEKKGSVVVTLQDQDEKGGS